MPNLPLSAQRCLGADSKLPATVCSQRHQCRRHLQIELDRQLQLPPEVKLITLRLPRVGRHECHYRMPA